MVLGIVGIAIFATIIATKNKKLIFNVIIWAILMLVSYWLTVYLWLYFFIIQIVLVIALFIPTFIAAIRNKSLSEYDLMFWYTLGVVALTMAAFFVR